MNQTITARFDSVDLATAAAAHVRAHFHTIKSIRMACKNARHYMETPHIFSDLFTPVGYGPAPLLNNGTIPELFNGNVFREKRQLAAHADEVQDVRLSLTLSSREANAVAASLRTQGGIEVRVS